MPPSNNHTLLGPGIHRILLFLLIGTSLLVADTYAQDQDPEGEPWVNPFEGWTPGPAIGSLGSVAEIQVPEAFLFGDAAQTREILELMENPSNGSEVGCLFRLEENDSWFVVFEFDPIGYVKDDEKDKLDAVEMMASMREGTKRDNELRRRRGWEEIELVGWTREPHYDALTNNLEWATLIRVPSGAESVNFNTRLLGRKGVMSVTLIASPERLEELIPVHHSLLANYEFVSGQRYAEFTPGDKIAEYGLTALVTGGALAAAAKTGLIARFWKLIVAGVVALGGVIKRMFGGNRVEAS